MHHHRFIRIRVRVSIVASTIVGNRKCKSSSVKDWRISLVKKCELEYTRDELHKEDLRI